MSTGLHFIVDRPGIRLDRYVSGECGELSRSYARKLIDQGYVTVNGEVVKASHKLDVGDRVSVTIPPPAPSPLAAEAIPLTIVYEDSDLLVVDKPAGLTVHPAPGHPSHTLVNAVLAYCPDILAIDGSQRPGIVHRLDKDTSGLMLVAKNHAAHLNLSQQLRARSIVRRYKVLVRGRLSPEHGAIEAPIGRDPRHRQRMAVVSRGRQARTRYRVLGYPGEFTLLEAMLETGRTHQIRVHLSAIGYPVVGDTVYGARSPFLGRQFVHAHRLRFQLPGTGEIVELSSELPPDLEAALRHVSGTVGAG
jgi:23S rRNA pseudouridine1911/1915/1917 synthase